MKVDGLFILSQNAISKLTVKYDINKTIERKNSEEFHKLLTITITSCQNNITGF